MKHPLAASALLMPALVVTTLVGCSDDSSTAPAKDNETSETKPVKEETPTTVTGLPLLEGVTAGIPEGWTTFDEGNLTYAVFPGTEAELDVPDVGDVHHQIEPWFTGTPNEAGETIVGSDYVQIQQVSDDYEYEVTEGYEVAIPGGYAVIKYDEHEFPEAGVITTTGSASLHSTDRSQHYYTFWDFGPVETGIPEMKQYLGSLSIG